MTIRQFRDYMERLIDNDMAAVRVIADDEPTHGNPHVIQIGALYDEAIEYVHVNGL